MNYFHIFIYYTFICSSVLFYCIGLNRTVQTADTPAEINIRVLLKSLLNILLASVLTFLVTQYILVPLKLVEIFPLAALFIFVITSIFFETVVRISVSKSAAEFALSYMIILLSNSETTNLWETIIIVISSMSAFVILLPLIYSFQKRIHINSKDIKEKITVLVFLSIAVLILILSVYDISWLNLK